MNRREFLSITGSAAAGLLVGSAAQTDGQTQPSAQSPPPADRMKVGCQRWGSSPAKLPFLLRHGVRNICASPAKAAPDGVWTDDSCRQVRQAVEEAGMSLDAMYLGVPTDVLIPEKRDAAIDRCRRQIAAAGKAGIPCLQYNLHVRVWKARTGPEPGRGGSTYGAWDLSKVEEQRGKVNIGPIGPEEMWDRIGYFLKAVVPAAAEARVRLACHPPDPPMPADNPWKIAQVQDTVEGLKRFVETCESPYHGLLFCQGCIWEMLPESQKPDGLYDAIRWFGRRKKIFGVHFRNLRGGREKFAETYHDEGEIDMFKAVRTYKEVGFDGMLMPDHVPHHADDPEGLQAFAFAYGYTIGLIQAAYAEV